MGDTTGISWTKSTMNFWMGCQRVSPACEHCYAETLVTNRMGYSGRGGKKPLLWGPGGERHRTSAQNWSKPLQWNIDAAKSGEFWPVFASSLSDIFEDRLELAAWRAEALAIVERTTSLTWLLLTKRTDRILDLAPAAWIDRWPPHVWIGTTIEDRRRAAERLPHLLQVPAATRFVSIEPQLESLAAVDLGGVQWAITGGESGPGARIYDPTWAAETIESARRVGAAPFVKQMGERWARANRARQIHGADPSEWPEALRVQEFPRGLQLGRKVVPCSA